MSHSASGSAPVCGLLLAAFYTIIIKLTRNDSELQYQGRKLFFLNRWIWSLCLQRCLDFRNLTLSTEQWNSLKRNVCSVKYHKKWRKQVKNKVWHLENYFPYQLNKPPVFQLLCCWGRAAQTSNFLYILITLELLHFQTHTILFIYC